MSKIPRRTILKTLGGISLGSFFPVLGHATGSKKMPGKEIKTINTDVLVVGGGTAGVIAALQAARAGCTTILVENGSQPGSLMFRIGGYDLNSLDMGMIRKRYDEEVNKGTLVREDFRNNIEGVLRSAGDNIQHVIGADSTTSESNTITNIKGRSSLLKTLRFLRDLPGCEKTKLLSMQPETGVRETYRIDGIYEITREDYVSGRIFDDSVCYSYYPIDLHDKDGVVPDHLKDGIVPTVPLRALIPKNSRNFIVAGRCVSSDRMANSALRVQASCMAMGQVAGATAALANKVNKTPLDIPTDDIKSLLKEHKAIVP